jgi:hypothetical protein
MLTLPPKFKQALGNGTRTSLYPLVRIYKGVQIDEPLDSATEVINLSIKETNISGEAYNPLLLNSPSISSKADIINNKYTISSVSLSISNAPYRGKVFSDDIPSLLNAVVQVYYAANGLDSLEDCLLVYTGTIRRYSQSAESLSLTLEDLTEQKLKTQIPSKLIENGDNHYDKNISKPFPMVYGYVDKSPLVLDKFDQLIIDKQEISIEGAWTKISSVNYLNPKIEDTELYGTWLPKNSYVSIYKDGYMPIMQEFPLNFGSRDYSLTGGNMYDIEANLAKISLQSNNFIYEKYSIDDTEDEDYLVGEGNVGIPTRIYRPVEKVSFFTKDHGSSKSKDGDDEDGYDYTFRPASSNKFYGFSQTSFHDDVSVDIDNETIVHSDDDDDSLYDEFDNNFSKATIAYDDAIDNGLYTWWEPTYANNGEGWGTEDYNFPSDNRNFNPNWIQDASDWAGIHIHAINRHVNRGGAFVRFELNQGVADFPAVTKIFYKINYYTTSNIGAPIHSEPTAFWVERQLISRPDNNVDNYNDMDNHPCNWDYYRDTEDWITYCEVPNQHHTFTPIQEQHRWKNENLGGMEYDNIILGFNSTNAFDSINWGQPLISGNSRDISSCFANLYQIYTIQDLLLPDYINLDYYASVIGRTRTANITTNVNNINYEGSYNIIFTVNPHRLSVGDTFSLYDEIGLYVGDFTVATVPLPNSLTTEESQNLSMYDNGKIITSSTIEITKAQHILQDILTNELDYEKNVVLPEEIIKDDWINSFSMNEQQEAKSVIENLFKSSIYIPSFDSEGDFKFIELKQNITDYSKFEIIKNSQIIKYSFSLTKLEDVKNQINIKYKKDYGANDFSEETTYGIEDNNGNFVQTLDELTEELTPDMVYDIGYYGIKNEDAKLQVETEYIRDKELQRRLLMWYANQHLTIKLDLPPSYMHLEAGDYLRFEELIGGKLAFGFDYTQEFVKNGQLIYPVFFVSNVSKSLSKVSLELVQVHRGDFGMTNEDLGVYEIPNPYDNNIYYPEQELDEDDEAEPYFTADWLDDEKDLINGQIDAIVYTNLETNINIDVRLVNSTHSFRFGELEITNEIQDLDASSMVSASIDVTDSNFGDNVSILPRAPLQTRAAIEYTDESEDGIEDVDIVLDYDLIITSDQYPDFSADLSFQQTIPPVYFILGDLNGDETININDLIILINITLDDDGLYSQAGDLNGDGGNNILDIVALVNLILD